MRLRLTSLLLISLLCVGSVLYAQAPGSPPQQPGQGAPGQTTAMSPEQQVVLDGILASWEADAKGMQSLFVEFSITEKDPVFQKEAKYFGEAKVLKMPSGQYGFKLETFMLDRNGKPDRASIKEKIVCSGTWLYTFDVASKTIVFRRLENQTAKPDDGPFAFLFGMQATHAKRRFTMSVVQQDQHYTWIKIIPLTPQDQRDFAVAQLGVVRYANAISPKDFPLRIMWREPGNKELSWEFKSVVRNDLTRVNMTDFSVEPEKKAGWQLREAPAMGAATTNPTQGTPTSGSGVPRK